MQAILYFTLSVRVYRWLKFACLGLPRLSMLCSRDAPSPFSAETMGNEQQQSPKIGKSCLSFRQVVQVVFFVIGLSIGITSSLDIKSFLLYLHSTLLSASVSVPILLEQSPPPPPSPLPLALQPPSPPPSPVPTKSRDVASIDKLSFLHNMDDGELFWRASMVPRIRQLPPGYEPKVAFMFLTKGSIPLAPLWEMFFKGHKERYTIYIHPHPLFSGSFPVSSVFHGRRIPSKVRFLLGQIISAVIIITK